jgi:hypothetical protein
LRKFFVNPDVFYTPRISISPFSLNRMEESDNQSDPESTLKVLGSYLVYTNSAKDAIRLAMKSLQLQMDDKVGIFTTSENTYVSNCVTGTISEFCSWEVNGAPEMSSCLFLIHEFGALISEERMKYFRSFSIPIINDFAYSFLSLYESGRIDFIDEINISSFPKSFNINFGGVLSPGKLASIHCDDEKKNWILNELKPCLTRRSIKENIHRRRINCLAYASKLQKLGFEVVWIQDALVPGVCMLSPQRPTDLHGLKAFLQRNGIECSVFYGRNMFFIPVHQYLTDTEIDYVCYMIGEFVKND